jgi:hypothetical protein
MILPDLIADFVAPLAAIVAPLLPVLDPIRAVPGNRAIADTRPVADARAIANAGPVANARTITNTGTRAFGGERRRSCPATAQEFCSRPTSDAAGDGACQIARPCGRQRAGPSRTSRRFDVQEVLQLAC